MCQAEEKGRFAKLALIIESNNNRTYNRYGIEISKHITENQWNSVWSIQKIGKTWERVYRVQSPTRKQESNRVKVESQDIEEVKKNDSPRIYRVTRRSFFEHVYAAVKPRGIPLRHLVGWGEFFRNRASASFALGQKIYLQSRTKSLFSFASEGARKKQSFLVSRP